MKTNEFEIYATVSGNIRQTLRLHEPMEPAELLAKLKSGEICTTLSHAGENNRLVISLNPFKILGKVEEQEALDDVEIAEFEFTESFLTLQEMHNEKASI